MSYKILIVEDNLVIGNGMASTLRKAGYEVLKIARSGQEAFDILKEEQPHLLLMDISLKGDIDGISTARIINRNYAIPLIFITQHTQRDIFLNAKETNPKNYITKPFTNEELIRGVDLALGESFVNRDMMQLNVIEKDNADGIFVYTKENVYEKLLFKDILYIESIGAYSRIYFERNGVASEAPYIVSISSNHVISQMEYADLVKIHRSYYVNIKKISKINNSHVFINDLALPISEKIKANLFSKTFNILKRPS